MCEPVVCLMNLAILSALEFKEKGEEGISPVLHDINNERLNCLCVETGGILSCKFRNFLSLSFIN